MLKTAEQLIESFKIEHPNITLKEQLSDYDKEKILNWPSIECPFFTDKEIEELKDYYSESGTESYHDYFNENMSPAISKKHLLITNDDDTTTEDVPSYSDRILHLQNKMKSEQDPEKIDAIKQNLVDIGWNPEIEYNATTQEMARNRFIELNFKKRNNIINLQPLIELFSTDTIIESSASNKKLYPVNIVLIRGNKPHSAVISKITKCDYSHAAIGLDNNFEKLYSFGVNDIKLGGGFTIESLKKYPKENKVGIYTFFVDKNDYDKLSNRFNEYLLNIKNTNFSRIGLLTFPFKNIDFTTSDNMICSQFVDSCLRLININLTNAEKSSKVSPAMLQFKLNDTRNVYKIYEGKCKDININKVNNFLNKLSKNPKKINEYAIYDFIVSEARKANIEIKNNGDVLLTNPFIDFDTEYMSSHKLLIQYEKANNFEGMKYELARLYYMNYILEKKLYHNKFLNNKEKNMKTRARVLNDFNKYIKIVLQYEPDFNFGKYYENSQFYPHTVEIKKSTLLGIKDVLKYIL